MLGGGGAKRGKAGTQICTTTTTTLLLFMFGFPSVLVVVVVVWFLIGNVASQQARLPLPEPMATIPLVFFISNLQ